MLPDFKTKYKFRSLSILNTLGNKYKLTALTSFQILISLRKLSK